MLNPDMKLFEKRVDVLCACKKCTYHEIVAAVTNAIIAKVNTTQPCEEVGPSKELIYPSPKMMLAV